MKDQEWFTKYAATKQVTNRDFWTQYDPDGYDSYGYDENEVDRAGNYESEYYGNDCPHPNIMLITISSTTIRMEHGNLMELNLY
jgi:hypothetical protein